MKNLAIGFVGVALTLAPRCAQLGAGLGHERANSDDGLIDADGRERLCASRHKTHSTRRSSGASSDNQANQLNAQELARLQAGGAPAPAPMPMGR